MRIFITTSENPKIYEIGEHAFFTVSTESKDERLISASITMTSDEDPIVRYLIKYPFLSGEQIGYTDLRESENDKKMIVNDIIELCREVSSKYGDMVRGSKLYDPDGWYVICIDGHTVTSHIPNIGGESDYGKWNLDWKVTVKQIQFMNREKETRK